MGDRVGDIVEFEIQKNRASSIHDGLHDRGALSREELQSDLAEGGGAEGVEQAHRPIGVRNI